MQVRLKGFPLQTETFARVTDAKRWAAKTETALREGRSFPERVVSRHTLGELLDRYVLEVLPGKKDQKRGLLRWWRAELGELKVSEVTQQVLMQARDKLAATPVTRGKKPAPEKRTARAKPSRVKVAPKKRSAASVNRHLAALSHVFTVAIKEWQVASVNPVLTVSKPKEPRGRVRYLDDTERESLLAAAKDGPPWLYPLVALGLSTGMRHGELLRLKRRDVNLDRKHLVVHESKNGERRGLPLAGVGLDAMRDYLALDSESELVWPTISSFRFYWDRCRAAAGLADFRFHDLRHTTASYLAMSGASARDIADVLGHKTLQMVQRYAHLSSAHVAGVVERMHDRMIRPTAAPPDSSEPNGETPSRR